MNSYLNIRVAQLLFFDPHTTHSLSFISSGDIPEPHFRVSLPSAHTFFSRLLTNGCPEIAYGQFYLFMRGTLPSISRLVHLYGYPGADLSLEWYPIACGTEVRILPDCMEVGRRIQPYLERLYYAPLLSCDTPERVIEIINPGRFS